MLCNRIKYFRKKLKLTQSQLADYVGVTKNAIYEYENLLYEPRAIVIYRLCKVLNVTFEELFYQL